MSTDKVTMCNQDIYALYIMQLLHIMQNVGVLLIMKSSILIKFKAKDSFHISLLNKVKRKLESREIK